VTFDMQTDRKHTYTLDTKYTYCLQLNCKYGENAFNTYVYFRD